MFHSSTLIVFCKKSNDNDKVILAKKENNMFNAFWIFTVALRFISVS